MDLLIGLALDLLRGCSAGCPVDFGRTERLVPRFEQAEILPVQLGLRADMGRALYAHGVSSVAGLAPAPSPVRSKALVLFVVQLGLNLLWTWLFFREHDIANALADIMMLWLAIGAEIAIFWRMRQSAAWLMAPYWAWVSFAVILNFAYWRLNPDSDSN